MKYWDVQKRILLITLLPCFIAAAALGGYFTYLRNNDLEQHAIERAKSLTRQLAMSAAQLFETSHNDYGQSLQPYLDLEEVRALAILTPAQSAIFHLGPQMTPPLSSSLLISLDTHLLETENSLRIRAPIYQNPIEQTQLLGWIEVEFSTVAIELAKYKAIVMAISLILLTCCAGFYLAYQASRRITKPLEVVAETLEKLETGDLDARVRLDTANDFAILADGINTMAASLQRSQLELQDSVEQTTHDLKETLEDMEVQNIELNMARRSALDASNTKSEFLANMSHEIRTPLNGILGFARLLAKTRLNKRQQDYLHTIETSSSSLLSIINDILDFSKIEAGKLVLDKTPVHIRDIMDEVLTMLAPEAHRKGLELASLVYQDVPFEIQGDPVRLKQVITNLVSNAVKFTDQGSVIARVMFDETLSNKKIQLRFSVTDTGIGLSEEQQGHLFKAFSQGDASTTRRFGGTGLGLVISKYLVDHMHGDIGLESTLGAGSCFWFTGQFEVSEQIDESWVDSPWKGQHAFVYCEWTTTGQTLQHQLMALGFQVTSFANRDAMLEKIEQDRPTISFIEVGDGRINQRQWQRLENYTQVVAMLPSNENALQEHLLQIGTDQHLVYPVASRRLIHCIQELLGNPDQDEINAALVVERSPVRVLAVDDNEPNLELLSTWLRDLEVEVFRARGGKQAVTMASNHHFHLIFMDIQMPDLDGVSAGKLIRQDALNQDSPLVALTAHALPNERKQLLKDGFDDYLTKPINEEQLVHTLMKWTHYQPSDRSLVSASFLADSNAKKLRAAKPLNVAEPINPVVDLESCLTLAGGKRDLAKDMMAGLLLEVKQLKPAIATRAPGQLIEPIHKLHGLCRYVGAPRLRAALEAAETCLKTSSDQWFVYKPALLKAIKDIEEWAMEHDWETLILSGST